MHLITQHFIMSRDLNAYGNVFGGSILAWLDEAGAVFVIQEINYTNIVTVAMADVKFRNPAHLGDIIHIYGEIIAKGRSSITTRVEAVRAGSVSDNNKVIIDCTITYVCLDKAGKPFPLFATNG